MNQADLDRAKRLSEQRQELEAIAYKNVCAMCSGVLLVYWDREEDQFKIACRENHSHQGHERLQSLYETWRRGGTLPVEVAQALDFKYGKKEEK